MENQQLAHHDTPREIVAAFPPHETGTCPETNGMMKTQHQGVMLALAWAWCVGVLPTGAAEPLTFERDVRPILKAYCLDCHGGGEVLEREAGPEIEAVCRKRRGKRAGDRGGQTRGKLLARAAPRR